MPPPDSTMILLIMPRESGEHMSMRVDMPPAEKPKTVMLSGSPPKAVMFSCTHLRAAIWSRSP